MTKYELSVLLGVHVNTVSNWIKRARYGKPVFVNKVELNYIPKFMYDPQDKSTLYFNGEFFTQADKDCYNTHEVIKKYLDDHIRASIKLKYRIADIQKTNVQCGELAAKMLEGFNRVTVDYSADEIFLIMKMNKKLKDLYSIFLFEGFAPKEFKDRIKELKREEDVNPRYDLYKRQGNNFREYKPDEEKCRDQKIDIEIQDAIDHWYKTQYDSHTPHDDRFEKQFERNYDADGNLI